MRPEAEVRVRSALPRLRLFWAAALGATLACAGLGALAAPAVSAAAAGETATPPAAVAIATLGALCAAATLALDRALLSPGRIAARLPAPDSALAERYLLVGHLALWSLALLPALLGFAQLLLDGRLGTHLALCGVSLAVLAVLLPSRARVGARIAAALG